MFENPEDIIFCKLNEVSNYIKEFNKVLLVGNYIKPIFGVKTISIPDGEDAKSMKVVEILWEMFEKNNCDKSSLVLSMGGGSASDAVGFAAATYMRGIPFASIPTTLLSMVDASIGSKRAINSDKSKNAIGCFYPAKTLFIDTDFVDSLPKEQINSGYCEAIKLSFVSGFDLSKDINSMIKTCIEEKQKIVAKDIFDEKGIRQVLNYGHTLGHAIEAYSKFSVPHGLAIAVGMDFAAQLSNTNTKEKQLEVFENFDLLDTVNEIKNSYTKNDVDGLIDIVNYDKKKQGDKISLVILEDFGKPILQEISIEDFKSSLLKYFK